MAFWLGSKVSNYVCVYIHIHIYIYSYIDKYIYIYPYHANEDDERRGPPAKTKRVQELELGWTLPCTSMNPKATCQIYEKSTKHASTALIFAGQKMQNNRTLLGQREGFWGFGNKTLQHSTSIKYITGACIICAWKCIYNECRFFFEYISTQNDLEHHVCYSDANLVTSWSFCIFVKPADIEEKQPDK